jgi:hypothetical protein
MPQLVKGGKHVYCWSEVGTTGRIVIPSEALADYNFKPQNKMIMLSGSNRSGGFALTTIDLLKNSRLSIIFDENPELASFQLPEEANIMIARKHCCCWISLNRDGSIVPNLETLRRYGVNFGDRLLLVKGSQYALAFCIRGPLIAEAKKHSNLTIMK